MPPRLLTSRQVAEMFNVHPSTVGEWQDKGRLRGIKTPGGQRRFREDDVLALLDLDPTEATATG